MPKYHIGVTLDSKAQLSPEVVSTIGSLLANVVSGLSIPSDGHVRVFVAEAHYDFTMDDNTVGVQPFNMLKR